MKRLYFLLFILFSQLIWMSTEFSVDKAKKVDTQLKRIAKIKRKTVFLRKITFDQDELNSYLNIVYVKKHTPEIKYIKLDLEKDNYVGGSMKVKLKGEKYKDIPSFLREFDIECYGKVECENRRMRYIFEKLKINGTSFSPEVLDEVFYASQTGFKLKKSMFDWFNLMPGLKNVIIDHKKISIFY